MDTQLDILTEAGCGRIFQDKITGVSWHWPALDELLGLLREGDTVLGARFFRLSRSRDHVIHLVNSFHQRSVHFKALDLGTARRAVVRNLSRHRHTGKALLETTTRVKEKSYIFPGTILADSCSPKSSSYHR